MKTLKIALMFIITLFLSWIVFGIIVTLTWDGTFAGNLQSFSVIFATCTIGMTIAAVLAKDYEEYLDKV